MADSIIDIVQRLTFEVNDAGLKKQIASFGELNNKINSYKSALSDSTNKDITTQKALQAELKKTEKARDRMGNSIIAQVASSKKLQDSIKKETELLVQLQAKLLTLETTRKKSVAIGGKPVALDARIEQLKSQIASLSSAQGGSSIGGLFGQGGVLGSLFGGSGGSIGRQLLQGGLIGLGIGGGFGLIARLVSGLIEYGETLLDVNKKQEKILKANEQFVSSISKIGDEIINLDKIFTNSLFFNSTDTQLNSTIEGFKRLEEAAKAAGIQNGEVYAAEANQLKASQDRRSQELRELKKQEDAYRRIAGVVNGIITGEAGQNFVENGGAPADLRSQLLAAGVPKKVARQAEIDYNDAKKNGAKLGSALLEIRDNYESKSVDEHQKFLDKQAEKDNAFTEFQSKLAEQEYELNRQLLIAQRKDEEQYNLQRLKDYNETAERIKQSINLERGEALKEVDDEIDLARKKGIYTTEIEQDYANKKSQINRKFNLQIIEQYQEFVRKYVALGDQLEQIVIKSQPNTLTALLNPDEADISKYQDIANARNKALLVEYDNYSEQLQQRAIKNGVTQEEIDKELGDRKELLQKQINANLIQAYFDYYKQIEAIDEREATKQINQLNLQNSSAKEKRSFDLLIRRLSPYRYNYLNQRGNLQTGINTNQVSLGQTKSDLVAAYKTQSDVTNDPKSTKTEIDAANAQVTLLEKRLADINTEINEQKVALSKLTLQHIAYEIQGYASLVDAALSAYQQINDAHSKYLDTEISIQTERVREAEVLAERGNTGALQRQEDILRKQEQQKELYAKRQIEINAALALSNAIVAVAEAAASGGPFAFATIAAVIAALGAGYAAVQAFNTPNAEPSFAEGGFTGHGGKHERAGTVHKGEFVTTAENTKKYRPLLEAIHNDKLPALSMVNDNYRTSNNGLTKSDVSILAKKLDENTEAVRESKMSVSTHLDRRGFSQSMTEYKASQRRKFL